MAQVTDSTPTQSFEGSVLIVDDDKSLRTLLRHLLRRDGYQITEAASGHEAINSVSQLHPDLVLLDIMMPDMNGFEVCTQICSLPDDERPIVLLVTGLNDDKSVDRAFEVGALDFITKPIHPAILRQRVRRLIKAKRADEALAAERTLLRTLIDTLPDPVYVKDTQSRFVINNLAHAQLMGSTPAEIIGRTDYDHFPLELAEGYFADDQQIIRSDQAMINREELTQDHLGHQHWILTTKVPLHDKNGKTIGLVGVSRDITERKKAEDTNILLASIVEATEDAVIGLTPEGIILSWNRGAEKVYGYAREEIVGQHIAITAPPERVSETYTALEKIQRRERIHQFETIRVRKDGKKYNASISISPLEDSAGKLTGISAITRDITERKKAERELSEYRSQLEILVAQRTAQLTEANQSLRQEITERNWAERALRQGEEQLRRITDNMLDMICQMDMKGVIQYTSPSCWNVLGYAADDLVGKSIYSLIHPDDRDAVMIAIRTVGRAEYRSHHANGQYVWLETLSKLLFENDAEPKGVILAIRGITERKLAEEALQQSDERFRQMAENIDDVFWMSSADHEQVIYVSPAYEKIWGQTCESLYAQAASIYETYYPEDREQVVGTIDLQLRGDYDEEYRIVRPDGAVRWIRTRAFPIPNEQGEIYRIAGISSDVTEHKRVEQKLLEINRLKTEFLSTAAHELRTPLTSIRGFSEILLTRQLDEMRQKRFLGLIDEQSTHLGKIIDDLLDVSRLEAKRNLELNLEPIEIAELIDKVLTPMTESNTVHSIQIEGLDNCPVIIGDPFRLSQVVKNLLSNAFKYSPKGGQVTIRGRTTSDYLEIGVQDCGIGMTTEQQAHLFEKFYRADASNVAISGTGLGLAISKVIVELHGGTIWAESQYQVGTTFYFTLPLNAHRLENPTE